MNADFWHKKWEKGDIGFHEATVNPLLEAHIGKLQLSAGSRIFLPLCGKTLDIAWLYTAGYRIAGVELSKHAVLQLFNELHLVPSVTPTSISAITRYSAPGIDILVGDIFAVDAGTLGAIDAVYDRAALVALPADDRVIYSGHISKISAGAIQLLITYEYASEKLQGPPFAVDAGEIHRNYSAHYQAEELEQQSIAGGLKGVDAINRVWLLRPRETTGDPLCQS